MCCLFLPSSDVKVGTLQSYATGVAVLVILEAAYHFFFDTRRDSPAVLSWSTIGTMNVPWPSPPKMHQVNIRIMAENNFFFLFSKV